MTTATPAAGLLEPLYGTDALPPNGSNTSFFSNAEFDRLIAEGDRPESNEEAIELYQAAEDVLLDEMPIAPMFFGQVQAVHSERVSNGGVDAFGLNAAAQPAGDLTTNR